MSRTTASTAPATASMSRWSMSDPTIRWNSRRSSRRPSICARSPRRPAARRDGSAIPRAAAGGDARIARSTPAPAISAIKRTGASALIGVVALAAGAGLFRSRRADRGLGADVAQRKRTPVSPPRLRPPALTNARRAVMPARSVQDTQRKSPAPSAGAEGATAPETLRPQGPPGDDALESGGGVEPGAHRRG